MLNTAELNKVNGHMAELQHVAIADN